MKRVALKVNISFKNIMIYYFSGTGNSRRVAKWIAESASSLKSNVFNIENIRRFDPLTIEPDSLLGIVFPTYGFTAPWKVIKFAIRLPVVKGCKAFVIATRGSLAFGSFLLPGFAGSACFLISLILMLKGYKILGLKGIDMPSNWMSLHPANSKKGAERILTKSNLKVKKFTADILRLKYRIFRINHIIEFLFAIALFPVSVLYLFIGHFFLAKLFVANNKCNGCGLCAKNCPVNAIKMYGKKKPRPYWTFKCESCMRCMNYCPQKAVEASYPFAVIAWLSSSVVLSVLLLNLIPDLSWFNTISNLFLFKIVKWIYVLFIFFIVYIVFYYILRIPIFNKLLTVINPIHYYRRYHEPDTKYTDFRKDNVM